MSEKLKTQYKAFRNGFKSLEEWFVFTVFLSGFPLLYIMLWVRFDVQKAEGGLTEIAVFFSV